MHAMKFAVGALALGTALTLPLIGFALPKSPDHSRYNHPGNLLISDQFNNRVIETDKKGNIIWQFGLGPTDFSANSALGVNDAERVGDNTLMAATGIPAGVDSFCPSGCPDNRVMLVDQSGNILWQYGQFGVTGSGYDELNTPVQATYLPDNSVIITDQGNQRVIDVDQGLNIVWQYGTTGVAGNGFDQLNAPNSAELLKNGDVLIADEGNNRVIEINPSTLNVDATFTAQGTMSGPAFASLLPNKTILVSDGGNNRVIKVDNNDNVVFEYDTNTQSGSNPNPLPSRAIAGRGNDIVISDQFNQRVIVIDQKGNLLTQYGNLNAAGYGTSNTQQGLFAPYDAKVIGEYKGLTNPGNGH
jgi:outer membrane protein assembly factor BamB